MSSSITLGIKLKLLLDKEQKEKLKRYFEEYGKAVNFALKVISKSLANDVFAGKPKRDENGKVIKNENNKTVYEFPEDFCSCGGRVFHYVNNKPFCQKCYKENFSENGFRKKMVPTNFRKVNSSLNIKNSRAKVSSTHYHYAVREAFQIYKSFKKQIKKKREKLVSLKRKLKDFLDMRDGKRVALPRLEKQKVDRFVHPDWKFKSRGYTLSTIESRIKTLTKNIEKEEKSLKKAGSHFLFKAKRVLLNNKIKFLENNKIGFTISDNLPKEFFIDLPKKEKKLNWLKEKIDLIKNSKKISYSYLLMKGEDFFVQFAYTLPVKSKDNYDGVVGLDMGVNHLAVYTFISNEGKVERPFFISNSEILRLKNLQKQRDLFLKRRHNKIRKKKNMRPIEQKIDLILHNFSKKIVEYAKNKNAFIAFEKLEKPKKSREKVKKEIKYKLSLFTFDKFMKLVEYKAQREGIKVVFVSPEYTSKMCSHCGELRNTERPYKGNSSLFKCNNCGVELNADYNASVNIGKKALNIIKTNN